MNAEIANSTLKALRRILRAVDRGNRALAITTGLTPSQLLVLREVAEGDAVTPGAVAQRLQFSHATITVIVDRLVTLELVTRTRSDQDKRQIFLNTTAEGARRLTAAPDMLQEVFSHRFVALPVWQQAMILAGAERMAAILDASDIDAAPLLDTGQIDRTHAAD